jgi:hypothetical protein
MSTSALVAIPTLTLICCLGLAGVLHEPVPRINDEFSYLLMSDTLTSGRMSNLSPPWPEFFDTFYVLVHPVYASKYFVFQGLFLALGQKLTNHPAAGLWLSSALACGASLWMLRAWIGPTWALLGTSIMVVQYGVFSYWSQSYWGGMVAALGGALCFGAIRRLWDRTSWQTSFCLALGLLILANSRPLEGLIAVTPAIGFLLVRVVGERRSKQITFWQQLVLPAGCVLFLGAAATGAYNRATTGSAWKPPYLLHEQQYQESPQFVFMPLRPKLTYSSPWVRYLYEVMEMRLYMSQRTPVNVMITAARKLRDWWRFYCGILLSAPLVLATLLKRGWIRYSQIAVLAGFILVAAFYVQESTFLRIAIDLLSVGQFVLLWCVFDEFWPRLALSTIGLLLLESFLLKYAFPHYFAPTACLVLYLQVEALRRIWHWQRKSPATQTVSRAQRRSAVRQGLGKQSTRYPLRAFVIVLPIACFIMLVVRVEARVNDWEIDTSSSDIDFLPTHDWSLRHAEIQQWLEKQPGQHLVFVRYFPQHDVNQEWVWNRADLMHAKVVWARDLGSAHNKLLLELMKERTVWSLLPDLPNPRLVPYSEVLAHAPNGILPPPEDPPFPKDLRVQDAQTGKDALQNHVRTPRQ